jgi:membrane protease YdiL (CAAX protease family)
MNKELPFQNKKFVLLFTGCVLIGLSFGLAMTAAITFLMQNALPWYTSITVLAVNHLCIYLIPGLVYWYWFEQARWKDFNRQPLKKVSGLWVGVLTGIVLLPFNELLIDWNKTLEFPEIFSGIEHWLIRKEQANSLLTERLFNIQSVDQLLILIIVSALIASIGEEVFFRGIIQNKIIQSSKSIHIGIWLTAALFSAIHLQFFGFFPRLVLGALFGYLYVLSGNLWVAILSHFINNTLFILTIFFEHQVARYYVEMKPGISSWLYGSSSLILSILLLVYFHRKNSTCSLKPDRDQ